MGLWIVAVAWMYVVVMMAVVEATAPNGTVLGAVFTFLLYGVLPLGILMYILGTPARRRRRLAADADGGGEPTGDTVAPERKEP